MINQGAFAAHMKLGSEPCGEREEDGDSGLDFDVDLNSIPYSSQDMENVVLNQ